jgi:anti-sigma factor RsiW
MSAEELDLDELLGAYALDALDPAERRIVDEYLRVNPVAAEEVAAHREMASMLAWTSMDAPAGLWDRIACELDDHADASPPSAVIPLRGPNRRAKPLFAWALATAAAVALVVIAVSAITGGDRREAPIAQAYQDAREDRDSRLATLERDGLSVPAVVDSDGHGYLDLSALPELPGDQTYQLWGVIDDKAISLGVFGPNPEIETFSAGGGLTALVITTERGNGVISDGNMDGALIGELV